MIPKIDNTSAAAVNHFFAANITGFAMTVWKLHGSRRWRRSAQEVSTDLDG
jgi:hypothetical protein